jgi:hypothetical protein
VKGFEGKKSDRFEYIHQSFADFIEDYAHSIDPTVRLSKRRLQLERGQVPPDLLSTTIVLHKNPDQYSKGHLQYILGTKIGLCKGEPLCSGKTYAAATTCDDCDFSFKLFHDFLLVLVDFKFKS